MTRSRISRAAGVVTAVIGLLLVGSAVRSQDRNLQTANADAQPSLQEASALATQSRELAESLVAGREAAQGRRFDPDYRRQLVENVAGQPLEKLQELQAAGDGALVTNAVGDTGADLVYTPTAPCRIIDTRLGGGTIAANTTRSFKVAGSTGFTGQGGNASGCGVPVGATSAMINFVAVGPVAPGDLRVTPFGTAMPLASILNWAGGVAGLNLANGLAVALCNPATTTCTSDITVQSDASPIDIVADVQGYFRRTVVPGQAYAYVSSSGSISRSKGFASGRSAATGVYCLTPSPGVSITTTPPVVSIDYSGTNNPYAIAQWRSSGIGCNAGELAVYTWNTNTGAASAEWFTIFLP